VSRRQGRRPRGIGKRPEDERLRTLKIGRDKAHTFVAALLRGQKTAPPQTSTIMRSALEIGLLAVDSEHARAKKSPCSTPKSRHQAVNKQGKSPNFGTADDSNLSLQEYFGTQDCRC
jgi:hypothetical protein